MKYLKKLILLIEAIFLISLAIFIYAWRIEPRWVEWKYLDMPIKNLPDSLESKTLIQISDLHIGETVDPEYIINTFKKINKLKPDIVVYTGDFISLTKEKKVPLKRLEKILKDKAEGSLGTVAIFGNHDYGILARNKIIADTLEVIIEKANIRVLRNEITNIGGLKILGIDDYWSHNFNLVKAMSFYDSQYPTLVLCHNPDVVDLTADWNNYQGWILSGHTHGGQVKMPFQKATRIPVENKNYDEGIKHLENNKTLYINRGLGHSIRLRLNTRPEITVFKLTKQI